MIHLTVNGEARTAPERSTVQEFVTSLGADPQKVVVEVNRLILKKDQFVTTVLKDGDILEIVIFVGGGN